MSLSAIIFYILAATIIIFSILTVTSRRILRAAVYLLFVLVATAGIYFLLNYQFMAAIQLTLYSGGIVVLIIFSILLTSEVGDKFERPPLWKILAGASSFIIGTGLTLWVLLSYAFKVSQQQALNVNMKQIGNDLLSLKKGGFVLPFEVISILLLAVMVTAIIIAKKVEDNTKSDEI